MSDMLEYNLSINWNYHVYRYHVSTLEKSIFVEELKEYDNLPFIILEFKKKYQDLFSNLNFVFF